MLRVVTPKKSSLFLLRSGKVIPVITNAIVITETNSLRIIRFQASGCLHPERAE